MRLLPKSGWPCILALIFTFQLNAQKKYINPLFPIDDGSIMDHGFLAQVGLNRTFFIPASDQTAFSDEINPDGFHQFKYQGRFGYMAGIGGYGFIDHPWIPLIDFGLRFSTHSGQEYHSKWMAAEQEPVQVLQEEIKYTRYLAGASVNIYAHKRLSEYGFLFNAMGLEVQLAFAHSATGNNYKDNSTEPLSPSLYWGLNYRIGYGVKMDRLRYILFWAETPVFVLYGFNDPKWHVQCLNGSFRPLTIGIQFLFLRSVDRPDCKEIPGINENTRRKKARLF